jgi:DeoR/GlpR family transcriptional regulator of sugar metabolism
MLPMSRTRNTQVKRIIAIVAMMQHGYWSTFALARRLGVSARTIRRDLAAMRYGRVQMIDGGDCWKLA